MKTRRREEWERKNPQYICVVPVQDKCISNARDIFWTGRKMCANNECQPLRQLQYLLIFMCIFCTVAKMLCVFVCLCVCVWGRIENLPIVWIVIVCKQRSMCRLRKLSSDFIRTANISINKPCCDALRFIYQRNGMMSWVEFTNKCGY